MPAKSRSEIRLRRSQRILSLGSLPLVPCRRCRRKSLSCVIIGDSPCSCCVKAGMEKNCDAEGDRLGRELSKQREALNKAVVEAAAATAKVARLHKMVRHLEAKSKKELEEIEKELREMDVDECEGNSEGENNNGSGDVESSNETGENGSGGSVNSSSSAANTRDAAAGTSPLSWDAWLTLPTEAGQGSADGIVE